MKLHGLEGQKLDDGGFKSGGDFFSRLGSGMHDPLIQQMRVAASTFLGASGGAMVPEKFLAEDAATRPVKPNSSCRTPVSIR